MEKEKALLRKEVSGYSIEYRFSRKHQNNVIRIRSLSEGRHYADHTRFNLLDNQGAIKESCQIEEHVARFIIENFEKKGDTASFNIYESDLKAGKLRPHPTIEVEPSDVRHTLTTTEHSFTSTGAKLNGHWPIFEKYRDTGFGSIVRATMTLHQVCSSKCHYCSTISRNRKDSITLEEAKDFVRALYYDQAELNRTMFPDYNRKYRKLRGSDIRLKGLILSGGGQPNLWPHFAEFVTWLSKMDIDLGLITNGFPKKVPEEVYRHFKWIRISVTPEDASPHYVGGQFNQQYLPATISRNPNVTVGYSYVYGPWTDDDILYRIQASMKEHQFDYCRLLTDCNLARSSQLRAHQSLSERLHRLGYIDGDGEPLDRFFHQLKYHGTPEQGASLWDEGQCFLQIYNVFWDTTGHEQAGHSACYACDSITVLAEEPDDVIPITILTEETDDTTSLTSERKFNHEKWGTVMNDNVRELFTKPVGATFDPRQVCSACLFMRNNETVKKLVKQTSYTSSSAVGAVEHVNFP